ncbi:hypothetical protein SYN65AY6LI_01275 [Synechococcus sp. 65AY6Li]|nr:hypothetical protein SYN65AY6LI_01275 [Synechococcus sp. 65AY6Li]
MADRKTSYQKLGRSVSYFDTADGNKQLSSLKRQKRLAAVQAIAKVRRPVEGSLLQKAASSQRF